MRIGQQSAVGFVSRVVQSAVGFGVTLVLTNVLGAETYGGYVIVLSVLAWLVVPAQFGVSGAVKKRISGTTVDEAKSRYVTAGWLVVGAATLLTAGAVLLFREPINEYMGIRAAQITAALLVARAALAYLKSVLQGQDLVHVSSLLGAVESLALGVVQVGLVVAGYGLVGAFAGYGVASALVVATALVYAHKSVAFPTVEDFRSLFRYARYSWLGAIRTRTFLYADTLVLAWFVADNAVVGVYGVAWNVATIFAVFSSSVSNALFPRISSLEAEGNVGAIGRTLEDGLAYGALTLIPGFVGSLVLGDVVLGIYGQGFDRGYWILLVFVVAQLFYAYASLLSNALGALDRPDLDFRVDVVLLSSNLVLNVVLGYLYGWYGTAAATATSALIALGLAYGYVDRLVTAGLPWAELGRQTAAAALMGVVVGGLRWILGDSLVVAAVLVAFGAGLYFVTLFGLSPSFRDVVRRNLDVEVDWV